MEGKRSAFPLSPNSSLPSLPHSSRFSHPITLCQSLQGLPESLLFALRPNGSGGRTKELALLLTDLSKCGGGGRAEEGFAGIDCSVWRLVEGIGVRGDDDVEAEGEGSAGKGRARAITTSN